MRINWDTIMDVISGQTIPDNPKLHPAPPVKKTIVTVTPVKKTVAPVSVPVTTQQTTVAPPQPAVVTPKPHTMNADSFFIIGTEHDVCQDYATHHNNGTKSYVVLADGCSGSKESDIGARVLVKTNELYIPNIGVLDFNEYAKQASSIYEQIIEEAASNAKALELSPTALDATLLSIVSNKTGDFMVTCYGDGMVALGRHDGIIETYSVSYKEGYPNYLSYRLSEERTENFKNKTENVKEVLFEMIEGDAIPLKQRYRSSTQFDIYLGSKEKYKWVAVLSDGVHSFVEKVIDETSTTYEPVPAHEVVRELLAFKNYQGTFVKRRVSRFLESCQGRKWTHGDDLSIGVVYLGDDSI